MANPQHIFHNHHRIARFLASLLLIFACSVDSVAGLTCEGGRASEDQILRIEPIRRLKQLGNVSDAEHYLQRTFLSPAAIQAGHLIQEWMEDAGLITWVDSIGNVHGRVSGANASAPALLLGSHLDTVIDAGMFDGSLGIISAIAAVKALHVSGKLESFPRPIEIIAFSDEEGVRFQFTLLGSTAVSGKFQEHQLELIDKSGVTFKSAVQAYSLEGTFESLLQLKYEADRVWSYVEVHIEQGPVLEREGLALGVVSAIAGQTRLTVKIDGLQGHAGTVPMSMRKDALAAAAAAIVTIEHICNHPEHYLTGICEQGWHHLISEGGLVCTVGSISAWPGASNVIPGQVTFTIDVRAEEDLVRTQTVSHIHKEILLICENRGVACQIEKKLEVNAVQCSPKLRVRLQTAAMEAMSQIPQLGGRNRGRREEVLTLVSGAGHDAMVMAELTKIGMLFVRCRGGISHSPAEHVLDEDVWAASLALKAFLEAVMVS